MQSAGHERRLASPGEPLGLAPRGAALHVHDLPVPDRQHLVALLPTPLGIEPLRRADDAVADLLELRLNLEPPPTAELEPQDLAGLVRPVSGRRVLPPEVAVRDAPPLALVGDQRDERPRIPTAERLGGRTQVIDHSVMVSADGAVRQVDDAVVVCLAPRERQLADGRFGKSRGPDPRVSG